MKKKTKLILMGVVLLLAIGAVVGISIVNNIKEANEPEEESSELVAAVLYDIENQTNIQSLQITYGDDTYTLIQNGTDSTGDIEWAMKEHMDWDLYYYTSYILAMGTKFSAYKVIAEDVTDQSVLDGYGLKNPVAVMKVTSTDGSVYTINMGNLSSDHSYAFCQLVGDNTIYACDPTYYTYFTYTSGGIRQAVIHNTPDTEDGTVVYLYAKEHGERAVEIEYDEDAVGQYTLGGATYIGSKLKFIQPYDNDALMVTTSMNSYFADLAEVEIVEIVDPNCQDLAEYGLSDEDPQYREKITTRSGNEGDYEYNTTDYVFGYTYNGGDYIYFREGDSNLVFGVDIACMDGRVFTPFDFVNQLMFLEIITNVDSATLTIDGQTYDLTILRQALDEENGITEDNRKTVYYVDGKLVDSDLFTSLYRAMISVAPDYEIVGTEPAMDDSDIVTFTLTLTDGTQKTITYTRTSEFYYVAQVGDDLWFATQNMYLDDIRDALQACLDAEAQ